ASPWTWSGADPPAACPRSAKSDRADRSVRSSSRSLRWAAAPVLPLSSPMEPPKTVRAMLRLGRRSARASAVARLVGDDDLLHQRMANDVHLGERAERDAVDARQESFGFGEPALGGGREIDLRHVSGDHRFRRVAE